MSAKTWGRYLRVRARWPMRAPEGKGPDLQRHTRGIAYRCYLPVLTGFTSSGCAGPGPVQSGGDERIRTADPLVANEVLSQLSYIPTISRVWPAPEALGLASNRASG